MGICVVLGKESLLCSMSLAPEDILLEREAVEQVREAIQRPPDEMREVLAARACATSSAR